MVMKYYRVSDLLLPFLLFVGSLTIDLIPAVTLICFGFPFSFTNNPQYSTDNSSMYNIIIPFLFLGRFKFVSGSGKLGVARTAGGFAVH